MHKKTITGDFENVKKYMNHDIQTERGEWIRTANEYRMRLGISWEDLKGMEKKHLKALIIEWDTSQWLEDVLHKPSLQWYRLGKTSIGYENCYRNTKISTYLAKARTNSLQLQEQLGRFKPNYDTTCTLCHQEEENLDHFMVKCPTLENKRDLDIIEPWKDMDTKLKTVNILFKGKDYERTANMIKKM